MLYRLSFSAYGDSCFEYTLKIFTTECFFPIRALAREKQSNKRFVSLVPRRISRFTSFPVAELKNVSNSHFDLNGYIGTRPVQA